MKIPSPARGACRYLIILNKCNLMKKKLISFTIIFLFTLFPEAFPRDFIVERGDVIINWTRGVIIATGRSSVLDVHNGGSKDAHQERRNSITRARMNTYAEARDSALEGLMSVIRAIRVSPEKRYIDMMRESTVTQQNLAEAISHQVKFRMYPVDYFSSGCEARITLGTLIATIPMESPFQELPLRHDTPVKTTYSGLIIDARGIGLKPMLFPSIYSEDGLEIYGVGRIDMRAAGQKGMVTYCYNEKEALKTGRAGDRPYYTVALKSLKGCPVIAERDIRKIFSSAETINNLKRCNVIIILNKEK